MKDYKILLKSALLISVLIFHTACSPASKELSTSDPASDSKEPGSSSAAEQQKSADSSPYHLISSPNGLFYSFPAQTADGFYELVYTKEVLSGAQNIVYTDFSTMHRAYLSSDINSDHQSETDTSYIPLALGGSEILTDGSYIYVFKKGSFILQHSDGLAAKPGIYRMDLNGNNRITIELPFDQEISANGGIFSDGTSLVLMMNVVGKDSSVHSELIRVDFSSQSITTLIDFSTINLNLPNISLISSFDDSFVLSSLRVTGDGEIIKELYTFDSSQGILQPLAGCTAEDRYVFYQHGNIYYIENSQNALYLFDPANGQSELVIPELVPPDCKFDSLQIGYPAPFPYLAFRSSNDDGGYANYYWNCSTHEWKESSLTDVYDEVTIYGIWQDYFLVNRRNKTVYYEDFAESGQSFTNQMTVSQYALISQNDFWNNIPNYIRFTDDVYGS